MIAIKAVIDRYEEEYAILLLGEEEYKVAIPKHMLPKNYPEGTWLNINIEEDRETTENQREKVYNLLEKLKSNNKKP